MQRFKVYFWNIAALKRQLACGPLPQSDAVAYYLMTSCGVSILFYRRLAKHVGDLRVEKSE